MVNTRAAKSTAPVVGVSKPVSKEKKLAKSVKEVAKKVNVSSPAVPPSSVAEKSDSLLTKPDPAIEVSKKAKGKAPEEKGSILIEKQAGEEGEPSQMMSQGAVDVVKGKGKKKVKGTKSMSLPDVETGVNVSVGVPIAASVSKKAVLSEKIGSLEAGETIVENISGKKSDEAVVEHVVVESDEEKKKKGLVPHNGEWLTVNELVDKIREEAVASVMLAKNVETISVDVPVEGGKKLVDEAVTEAVTASKAVSTRSTRELFDEFSNDNEEVSAQAKDGSMADIGEEAVEKESSKVIEKKETVVEVGRKEYEDANLAENVDVMKKSVPGVREEAPEADIQHNLPGEVKEASETQEEMIGDETDHPEVNEEHVMKNPEKSTASVPVEETVETAKVVGDITANALGEDYVQAEPELVKK